MRESCPIDLTRKKKSSAGVVANRCWAEFPVFYSQVGLLDSPKGKGDGEKDDHALNERTTMQGDEMAWMLFLFLFLFYLAADGEK